MFVPDEHAHFPHPCGSRATSYEYYAPDFVDTSFPTSMQVGYSCSRHEHALPTSMWVASYEHAALELEPEPEPRRNARNFRFGTDLLEASASELERHWTARDSTLASL